MFSDLECDFVNPIDLCAKLNPVNQTLKDEKQRLYLILLFFSLYYLNMFYIGF